jgi:MFS family permease
VSGALGRDAFLAWGWRVPFLASAVMVAIGLVIRFKVAESPDFERLKQAGQRERMPLVAVLRRNSVEVLLGAGALMANSMIGYIVMAYLLSYGTAVLGLSRSLLLTLILVGAAVWLAAIPWASALSDRHGRGRVLLFGAAGLTVVSIALFPLVDTRNPALILVALASAGLVLGITYGPLAALLSEMFPASVRYSGASLGYQIGAILGGGLAPTIAAGLYGRWRSSLPITIYLAATCLVSLLCVAVIARRASPTR